MKPAKILAAALLAALAIPASAQESAASQTDSLSRAVAAIMADNVQRSVAAIENAGFQIDPDLFRSALVSALQGQSIGFDAPEANAYLTAVASAKARSREQEQIAWVEQMRQASDNAVVLDGGTVLVALNSDPTAPAPSRDGRVRIAYTGKLSDGTEFDKQEEIVFDVSRLIPGFTEGLLNMNENGAYRIFIPPSQAYGEKGVPNVIPPYSALEFFIVLKEVLPPADPQ